MLVKEGYQQTAIGIIPCNWNVSPLDDLCKITGGKRLPKGSALTEEITPHPYIRVTDMFMGGINVDNLLFVPENVFPVISRYIILKEDLFISVAGTLGIIGKVPFVLDGASLTENADRLSEIKCNKDFLFYVLTSSIVQNVITQESTMNAQPKLALSRIKTFQIPTPPLKEQQKIAEILSTMDDKLAAIESEISATETLKKGLMQTLLTQGIGHTKLKESPLGQIPESWEVKTIEDVAKVTTGNKDTQNKIENGDYPFFVRSQTIERINSYSYDGEAILTAGDGVGVGKVYHYINGKFDYHQRVYAIIKFTENMVGKFLFEYFKHSFYARVSRLSAKNSVDSIRMDMITKMLTPVPPIDEQRKIAEILSTVDRKLDTLTSKKSHYQALKKGLMQKLLTGEVRVKVSA